MFLTGEIPSCFEHGFEYVGAYLETHMNVVSARQCHKICQKIVRCVAFTWNSNGTLHQCDLKETVVSRQIMILHPISPVSGPKYCLGDNNDKQTSFYYFKIYKLNLIIYLNYPNLLTIFEIF